MVQTRLDIATLTNVIVTGFGDSCMQFGQRSKMFVKNEAKVTSRV